jgi:hypothetical protein
MHTIDITERLLLELHPQRPSVHLVSLDARLGDEAVPGVVVVRPAEIKPLIEALARAAGDLAAKENAR